MQTVFFRAGDRRQEGDILQREVGWCTACGLVRVGQRAGAQQRQQVGIAGEPRTEIDRAGAVDRTPPVPAVGMEAQQFSRGLFSRSGRIDAACTTRRSD